MDGASEEARRRVGAQNTEARRGEFQASKKSWRILPNKMLKGEEIFFAGRNIKHVFNISPKMKNRKNKG